MHEIPHGWGSNEVISDRESPCSQRLVSVSVTDLLRCRGVSISVACTLSQFRSAVQVLGAGRCLLSCGPGVGLRHLWGAVMGPTRRALVRGERACERSHGGPGTARRVRYWSVRAQAAALTWMVPGSRAPLARAAPAAYRLPPVACRPILLAALF